MVLADIKPGCKARITNMESLNEMVRRRLMDLGVADGVSVRMKRILPFGGPVAVEAGGQWIGLRRCDARRIEVAPS
ncbi:FeoA family protein [Paenibacillus pinistramenti]|uniref:FeoA family protein n=1 Tax=Paenibacillus pinistramenti TaxID=1768003 RepID=UPI001107F324|nr:FeoA family protein [Paenibacillus pinistramenti]